MGNVVRRRRGWLRWTLVLSLVAGLVAVIGRRVGAGPRVADSSPTAKVERGDLSVDVLETGTVEALESVAVKSKVSGQVARVFVDAGDRVHKGQLLLRLDPVDSERTLARTAADVESAANALEYAELTLRRREAGLKERGTTQIDVDSAAFDARAKRVLLHQSQVAYRAAADQLRYTRILSPIDGTVTERGIQPGEVVTPGVQATFEGRPLFTVANLSTLIVRAELNQIDVAKVRLGQSVTVTLDAVPGRSYAATITKIAPASVKAKDRQVDVFPVEATLARADGDVKPGMTADVRIHIETRRQVLMLPIEALVKEGGKAYVMRLGRPPARGAAATERVEVEVGARNDHSLEITRGVADGERVLIKPASSSDNEYKM